MTSEERLWGGLTSQERSDRRREQLLEAGLDAFGTRGWGRTTVRDITAAAGLSQRYFYEHFDDREACFAAVLRRVAAEVEALVLAAVSEPGTPDERASRTLDALLEYFLSDQRRLRVAFVESFATAELRASRAAVLGAFATLASRLMTALARQSGDVDRHSLALSASLIAGGIAEILVEQAEGNLEIPTERLVEHLLGLYRSAAALATTPAARA